MEKLKRGVALKRNGTAVKIWESNLDSVTTLSQNQSPGFLYIFDNGGLLPKWNSRPFMMVRPATKMKKISKMKIFPAYVYKLGKYFNKFPGLAIYK